MRSFFLYNCEWEVRVTKEKLTIFFGEKERKSIVNQERVAG
jgi:hypothetical protein